MNSNKMQMVCIDCVNANIDKDVNAASNFKIPVEFGGCDCCGKRYIIVPFRRFFKENTLIVSCLDKPQPLVEGELIPEIRPHQPAGKAKPQPAGKAKPQPLVEEELIPEIQSHQGNADQSVYE